MNGIQKKIFCLGVICFYSILFVISPICAGYIKDDASKVRVS